MILLTIHDGAGPGILENRIALIIQEAPEGFASGRFQSQGEVKRFLESRPEFPKVGNGYVRWQQVADILTRPLYAGYVEKSEWEVSLRKGRHEGLINALRSPPRWLLRTRGRSPR